MNNNKKTKKFNNNFLEYVISYMAGSVYWLDRNCVYLGCNDNTAKLMGLNSKQEIIGKTYEDIGKMAKWTAEHAASWKQDTLEVISTGKPKLNIKNKPILLPSGRKIFCLSNLVPLFDDKKTVIGVIGNSIDISDYKKIEKTQIEKEVAKKNSTFMQRLTGSIAHEIRTPLAIIGVNVDLLERTQQLTDGYTNKEIQKQYLKTIKYAVKSASRIIDNILTVMKTLSSKAMIKNEFQYLSIAESVESIMEIYPFLAHEKTLVYFEKSKDFVYYGDRILTQHMLFNLIKNALFSIKEAGKGKIMIRLEIGKTNNNLIFTDTALGIAKKELPLIFDQFEEKNEGASLCLAFCKTVMHSYGGDISYASKLGKYTRLTLSFPTNTKEPREPLSTELHKPKLAHAKIKSKNIAKIKK
jgi:two-component system aerobic respiration control sensor histidine kinase ArcB